METENPLNQLRDIHLPEAVSWWPPAPAWWVLAAALVVLVFFLVKWLLTLYREQRRKTAAISELEACYSRFLEEAAFAGHRSRAGIHFLGEINAVLRRVALARFPQDNPAALSGRQWLEFLDACDGGRAFTAGPGQALGEDSYRPDFRGDAAALFALARRWIENRYGVQWALFRRKHSGAAR